MNIFNKHKRILILAPHTDDGEFGCGASIARFIESGKEVFYVSFSACEQSVLPQFPKDILITEVKAATQTLGIKPENLILYSYQVRTFNYHRQEILDHLIELRSLINPDLVFMPSVNDIHQDHHTIATEGLRAFKFKSILCYEMPWNNLTFNTSAFIHLDERHVQTKINSIQQYQSQQHRSYSQADFIRSWAIMRGVQINSTYAETFDVVRWIFD